MLTAGVVGAARLPGASLVALQLPFVVLPLLRTPKSQLSLTEQLNFNAVMSN